MIIEHDHSKVTPSESADRLEKEIETIEENIAELIQQLLNQGRKKLMLIFKKPENLLLIAVFLFFQLIRHFFSKEASFKRRITLLKNQNYKLKNQNKRLQHLLTRSKKRIFLA